MTKNYNINKWPKTFPPLSDEREKINHDFVLHWHEILPKKYGIIDEFNHRYVVKNAPKNFRKTLEIGAGTGEHLKYERLTQSQKDNYFAVDIRSNMINEFKIQNPGIHAIVADCQEKMDFDSESFDRILAIHVLEHLPNLPAAIREIHRLCCKDNGILSIVIPCEGSIAYSIARKLSAQRIFEARYKQPYKWFIEREHINLPNEIFEELLNHFELIDSTYFPIPLKIRMLNLCIGANLKPK